MTDTKTIYVPHTNTDLTEGRGFDVPIAICTNEATASRLGKGKYVQGSNSPIKVMEMIKVEDTWYVPIAAVRLILPTVEDTKAAIATNDRKAAIDRAIAAGLTNSDLLALGIK